jgi:hypothetical protein
MRVAIEWTQYFFAPHPSGAAAMIASQRHKR